MKIIGLTGGIGSGKSTVAEFFSALDVPVYNSDEEAKALMVNSKKLKKSIIALLGKKAYKGKILNKTYIADKIFKDGALLQKMNDLVHPAVRKHFLKWAKKQDAPYVIQETALIFENSVAEFYDGTILVTAPENIRVDRVMKRDDCTKKEVMDRLKKQLPDAEKIPFTDHVIENLELEKTRQKVIDLHQALLDNS
jgi:dephospho-CoA kinase